MNTQLRLIHTDQIPLTPDAGAQSGQELDTETARTIIKNRSIAIYLQPIVALAHGGVMGYEALARGPEYSPLHQAGALFGAAAKAGLTHEIEALCVAQALLQLPRLPAHMQLFVNAGPDLLIHGALGRLLDASPLRQHFHRLVIEITEHQPFGDLPQLRREIRDLHARGISVALDDFGYGFSDLKTVKHLRPDIVKIPLDLIRDTGPAAQSAQRLTSMCSLLARHGARVVVEGVESGEQAMAVEMCGAHWAQGYYFSRPRPADEFAWDQSSAWPDQERSRVPAASV